MVMVRMVNRLMMAVVKAMEVMAMVVMVRATRRGVGVLGEGDGERQLARADGDGGGGVKQRCQRQLYVLATPSAGRSPCQGIAGGSTKASVALRSALSATIALAAADSTTLPLHCASGAHRSRACTTCGWGRCADDGGGCAEIASSAASAGAYCGAQRLAAWQRPR